eukprot:12785200-Alexandrium_andersonii.AAC.1
MSSVSSPVSSTRVPEFPNTIARPALLATRSGFPDATPAKDGLGYLGSSGAPTGWKPRCLRAATQCCQPRHSHRLSPRI